MANSTSPVPQVVEGTGAVAKVNDLFDAGSQPLIGGVNKATLSLLTWGYLGGRINGINVANGTVTLTASTTNYVVMKKSDGVVSTSTATTNWDDSANYWRLYSVVTGTTGWTSYNDERTSNFGLWGLGAPAGLSNPMTTAGDVIYGGGSGTPTRLAVGAAGEILTSDGTNPGWAPPRILQNSKSAAYTTVLSDAGKHILHPSADTTARTFTIDSNANVPYPIGTAITFVNQNGAGTITISITSDTMRLAGPGSTGSRTLAANGMATALKITPTEWLISGSGLT